MTHYLYIMGDVVVVVTIAPLFPTHEDFILLKRPHGGSRMPCGHGKGRGGEESAMGPMSGGNHYQLATCLHTLNLNIMT